MVYLQPDGEGLLRVEHHPFEGMTDTTGRDLVSAFLVLRSCRG